MAHIAVILIYIPMIANQPHQYDPTRHAYLLSTGICIISTLSLLLRMLHGIPTALERFSDPTPLFNLALLFSGALLLWLPSKGKLGALLPFYICGLLICAPFFAPKETTAYYFLLSGTAILLLESNRPAIVLAAQGMHLFTAIAGYLATISFLYDLRGLHDQRHFIYMAPSTAIGLVLLNGRLLLLHPAKGIMQELTGTLIGSVIFRTLLPVAILVPTILGILRLWGYWKGYYSNEAGVALFVVSCILIFLAFMLYTTMQLNRRDRLRLIMQQSLQQRDDEMQALFGNAPDAIVVIDGDGKVTKWNQAAEKLFGWPASEITGRLLSETIVPHEYREEHKAGLERYIRTGESHISFRTIEMPALRKDGEGLDVAIRIAPYKLYDQQYFVGFLRDVSAFKQAERKRMLAEQKFTGLFESAPDATLITNEREIILYANQQASQLFGLPVTKLIGRDLSQFIPHRFRQLFRQRQENDGATKSSFSSVFETHARTTLHASLPVEISLSSIYSEEGILFSCAIRDITERKANEAKLNAFNLELSRQVQEKTKELNEVLERLTDAFIGLDKNFRYTYLNRKAGEMIRHQPRELLGRSVWDVFPEAIGSGTYHAMMAAMATQKYISNIDYFEPLDLWQENHIYPSPEGLSVFIRNITQRKRTEKALQQSIDRYQTFVEEGVDAIMVFSVKEQRYTDVNRKSTQLLGYEARELLQMHPRQLLFDDDPYPLQLQELEKGGSVTTQRRLRRKDGSGVEVETSATLLSDGSILAFVRDITERKQNERELVRLNEELRTLAGHLQTIREEERIHIAREIHDELGQLMTVIKMEVKWLKKHLQLQQESMTEKLDELLTTVDLTMKTIRKISSELRPSLLDDIGLNAAIEWHLGEFGKRTGISTNALLPEMDAPLTELQKTSLFRIVQEALTNVARHSQATAVELQLEWNSNQLLLTIRDNGIGFDAQQPHRKTLGILGMKERSLMINADYTVDSKEGNGTRVTVTLPLKNEMT